MFILGASFNCWEKQQLTNNSLYRFDLTTDINQTENILEVLITIYRIDICKFNYHTRAVRATH
jgi:hypothetical protein